MGRSRCVTDDALAMAPRVSQGTLAAWRAELAKLRETERQQRVILSSETGRLLEMVGHVLAQGGGTLPAADIARIEALTRVEPSEGKDSHLRP
jgi:hypothetical protein